MPCESQEPSGPGPKTRPASAADEAAAEQTPATTAGETVRRLAGASERREQLRGLMMHARGEVAAAEAARESALPLDAAAATPEGREKIIFDWLDMNNVSVVHFPLPSFFFPLVEDDSTPSQRLFQRAPLVISSISPQGAASSSPEPLAEESARSLFSKRESESGNEPGLKKGIQKKKKKKKNLGPILRRSRRLSCIFTSAGTVSSGHMVRQWFMSEVYVKA